MTLLVRDEADVVDAHLAFHLNAGVDFVIAMDHRSCDGTTEILESYQRDGYLHLIRQPELEVRQSEWVTSMARLAASDYGADWVINSDADEFWWPRAPSLSEALDAVPQHYGVVYAPMCYFLPLPGDGEFFERMTVRLLQQAPINNPLSRYRPSLKAAHRAKPSVLVRRGNHGVEGAGRSLVSWHPLELFHFPDRSPEQFARKYANTIESWPREGREPGAFVLAAHGAVEQKGARHGFHERAVGDRALENAASVAAVLDTRLRDALRSLRSTSGTYMSPRQLDGSLHLGEPTAGDDVRHAVDAEVLVEADLIRMQRDIDDLDVRLRELEGGRKESLR